MADGKSLEESTIEFVMTHPDYLKELDEIALKIREIAKDSPNEATLATNFELKLYAHIKSRLNIEFEPIREESIATKRHVKKGRIDSRIGALVIEYKQKSKLTLVKDQESAVSQLKNYIENLPEENRHGAIGVITDGWKIKFLSLDLGGSYSESSFEDLNGKHLKRFISGIITSDKKALTPKNLIESFCKGGTSPSHRLSSALFNSFESHPTGRTKMLFREWKAIFKLAHDDHSKQKPIQERRESLAEALNIKIEKGDNETEYKALYSIQTCYAIIVKTIAYKVLSAIRYGNTDTSFSDLAETSGDSLRAHLMRLESGSIFRDEGFGNLLEGDFFAWYCTDAQWDSEIADAIKVVLSILSEYENHHMFNGGDVEDLFKDLYMSIIPDKVRHCLGEFYTPAWLAEQTIQEAINQIENTKDWTALDPCCGSGTFITALMRKVLKDVKELPVKKQLRSVLDRVKGIDLNPLAALTTRINYFINIAHLIDDEDTFDVPIYLGDASYVPYPTQIGDVLCISYQISTEKGPLDITLPYSAVNDTERFSRTMTALEIHIENENEQAVEDELKKLVSKSDLTAEVKDRLNSLSKRLVELQRNKWNGIWARIISNFLTTANLGKFDLIVGNPPWIDWKNLPQGYRERIKGLCIDRNLFSGDGITGGINLNICALIANVSAQNWLKDTGSLGFLMPQSILFQQSYEGFRNLNINSESNDRLYFQKFIDWTQSGHPFHPVQHKFHSFFIGFKEVDYAKGVPVDRYIRKKKLAGKTLPPLREFSHSLEFSEISSQFEKKSLLALTANETSSAYSYAEDYQEGEGFRLISGKCTYKGREGVEIYPQELFLLKVDNTKPSKKGKVFAKNYQSTKSKHKIAQSTFLIETDYLYPLIKGVNIKRFHYEPSEYVVPFPYEHLARAPISSSKLALESPLLLKYFNQNRAYLDAQTEYNEKIIGKKHNSEYYSLARVGEYSYGEYFVAFRDNTKWGACVISSVETPWGEEKRPIFQNHAVTISQREDGSFISKPEAHFICAILNAPIVSKYLLNSSDSRSYKIRPPIRIPQYDPHNLNHVELSMLSEQAHANHNDTEFLRKVDTKLDEIYQNLMKEESPD